jgi:hypothetical protein
MPEHALRHMPNRDVLFGTSQSRTTTLPWHTTCPVETEEKIHDYYNNMVIYAEKTERLVGQMAHAL